MDTRQKIVDLQALPQFLAAGEWMAVAGLFDPLTVTQAERLEALAGGRKLLAIVLDVEGTLLPAAARAALIAGLRTVTNVAVSDAVRWRTCIPAGARVQIVEDEAADRKRSAEFERFIVSRQR